MAWTEAVVSCVVVMAVVMIVAMWRFPRLKAGFGRSGFFLDGDRR